MSKQHKEGIKSKQSVISAVVKMEMAMALGLSLITCVALFPQGALADNNERLGATVKGVEIPVLEVCDQGTTYLTNRAARTDLKLLDIGQVREASRIINQSDKASVRTRRAG